MTDTEKTFRRIPSDALLAGVCAGLAKWLDYSVWAVRFVVLLLLWINPFLLVAGYLLLAIFTPVEKQASSEKVARKMKSLEEIRYEMERKKAIWDKELNS